MSAVDVYYWCCPGTAPEAESPWEEGPKGPTGDPGDKGPQGDSVGVIDTLGNPQASDWWHDLGGEAVPGHDAPRIRREGRRVLLAGSWMSTDARPGLVIPTLYLPAGLTNDDPSWIRYFVLHVLPVPQALVPFEPVLLLAGDFNGLTRAWGTNMAQKIPVSLEGISWTCPPYVAPVAPPGPDLSPWPGNSVGYDPPLDEQEGWTVDGEPLEGVDEGELPEALIDGEKPRRGW